VADVQAQVTIKVVPELLHGTSVGRALVRIASLLIRIDMDRVDGDQSPSYETRMADDLEVMGWAVDTAGHLFDAHDLWDYDLVSDADHVHRCFTHRHLSRTLKDRRLSRAQ
jgi:hypothetical protein